MKRFGGKLTAFGEPIVCTKRREGGKRRVFINGSVKAGDWRCVWGSHPCSLLYSSDGDPRGKHVVIVDDLVQTVSDMHYFRPLRFFVAISDVCVFSKFLMNSSSQQFTAACFFLVEFKSLSFICFCFPCSARDLQGGTLLECAKALLEAGAKYVSAYVTHAVFPCESWRKFVTCPSSEEKAGGENSFSSGLPSVPVPADGLQQPEKGVRLEFFWITNSNPLVATLLTGIAPFEVLSITPVLEDLLGV